MKKFLPLLALLLCGCGQKPAETPKISIFCDHIWTVARQEGISFREAATKIREIGYDGWLTVEQYGSRQMLADSQAAYANVTAILKGE